MYRRSDGRQGLRFVFIAEFHRQPMEFIQQWCYMVSLSFFSERAELHCSELSAVNLFVPQANRLWWSLVFLGSLVALQAKAKSDMPRLWEHVLISHSIHGKKKKKKKLHRTKSCIRWPATNWPFLWPKLARIIWSASYKLAIPMTQTGQDYLVSQLQTGHSHDWNWPIEATDTAQWKVTWL